MFPEGNVPGYVCNPGSPRERDAASLGHTSGIPTRALLHSWKLAPAAHHALLSILVVTSPAPDVWLSILTDYTYDSELDIADGVPLAFRRSVSFPRGTRVTYVTWDVICLRVKYIYFKVNQVSNNTDMIGNADNTTQLKEPFYQLCVSAYPHFCPNQF